VTYGETLSLADLPPGATFNLPGAARLFTVTGHAPARTPDAGLTVATSFNPFLGAQEATTFASRIEVELVP
jgi:hypothetical protein